MGKSITAHSIRAAEIQWLLSAGNSEVMIANRTGHRSLGSCTHYPNFAVNDEIDLKRFSVVLWALYLIQKSFKMEELNEIVRSEIHLNLTLKNRMLRDLRYWEIKKSVYLVYEFLLAQL